MENGASLERERDLPSVKIHKGSFRVSMYSHRILHVPSTLILFLLACLRNVAIELKIYLLCAIKFGLGTRFWLGILKPQSYT